MKSENIYSVKFFTVGQLFGNMPVKGVLDPDIHNIEFEWLSFRTIYALVYILVGTFEVCLMVFKGFTKGFNIVTAGETSTIYITQFFFQFN